ncbi:hypothetical protein WICMUC_004076 [Wickerhamomyces mucosus]|uniref:RRM domain-containing protein n=1 Tax=Wickerhamomyces mucosus TaxID=1378264 RepID=A0A9P8PKA3_9ASCO|nr:hypothetical protein WICMUC_004076 [Wickerhamomyces mucosus]
MSIIVSNIPNTVPKDEIEKFFQFCGKIDSIEEASAPGSYKVNFVSSSAVSTALLLNGAQLGGSSVTVEEFEDGSSSTIGTESNHTPGSDDDIEQEVKPKSAIFAEYLSHGYILGDHLVSKAVDYDKQNGISDKFNRFISDLNNKYNLQEKQHQLQKTQNDLDSKYKISENLIKYYNQLANTSVGSKIHSFYTNAVNDTLQVHEEAKRLAELKKHQAAATGVIPSTTGNIAQAAGQQPIEKS